MLSEFYGADILQDVGYDDRSRAHSKRSRKRKRRQEDKSVELSTDNDTSKQKETEWQQLKQFLDPNPQLRGTTQGDDQPQVTQLYHFILHYVTMLVLITWVRCRDRELNIRIIYVIPLLCYSFCHYPPHTLPIHPHIYVRYFDYCTIHIHKD